MARSLFPPWLAWLAGWLLAPIATTPKAVHIQFEEPTSVQIIEQPRRRRRRMPSCSLARSLAQGKNGARKDSLDRRRRRLPPSLVGSLARQRRPCEKMKDERRMPDDDDGGGGYEDAT